MHNESYKYAAMKKILVPISNSFFVRNFLRAGFLDDFDDGKEEFFFAVPKEKLDYYKKEFNFPNANFVETPPIASLRLERIFHGLETSMIPTRTVKMMHWFHFKRRGTKQKIIFRLPQFIFRMTLWNMGKRRLFRELLRFKYSVFSDRYHYSYLKELKPDLIFCPTMVYGNEWIFLREGRRLGIKTVGMTSNWDNLYAKTFLRVKPDSMMVQTGLMKKTAGRFCDYPSSKIKVTGVPQYDRHFKDPPRDGRQRFLEDLGGDTRKKTILYAFSGKVTSDLDERMVDLLSGKIGSGGFAVPVQLLVRSYPKRDFTPNKIEKLRQEKNILIRHSAKSVGDGKNSWEFDNEAIKFLSESLAYSDVVITACSTFLVEAAVFNRPVISINFDAGEKFDYWNSARRFFDWDHLADLVPLKGIHLSDSPDDLYKAVNDYLRDPKLDEEGRKNIVRQQCTYTDGKSVQRVAEFIKNNLNL